MRRQTLLLVSWMLLCSGCAAQRLVKQGDAALLAGEGAQAANYYRRGLEEDSGLAGKEKFRRGLTQARTLAAYDKGVSLGDKGDWEKAMGKFAEALELDPNFAKASAALANAKRRASKARHAQAIKYADKGQLDRAVAELRRALELDPDNFDAKEALDSVTRKRQEERARAEAAYVESLALIEPKRWGQAESAFGEVLAADPNHLPARAKLHQAQEQLGKAKALFIMGSSLLRAKSLDKAIEVLENVVDIWPHHPEVDQRLAEATNLRRRAEELYVAAAKLAGQSRWDDTVAAARSALAIFPGHPKAKALHASACANAAEAHWRSGEAQLAKANLVAAEAEYLRCFDFMPRYTQARQGLARLYTQRGAEAEKAQQWGSALLWHMESVEQYPSTERRRQVKAMRSRVHARAAFAVGVNVGGAPHVAPHVAAVSKSLLASLSRKKPGFLTIAGAKPKAAPAYTAQLRVTELLVSTALTRSENRIHRYSIERDVPNPEIPRLQGLLASAEHKLDRLRADFNRRCAACAGTGRVRCTSCGGRGHRRRDRDSSGERRRRGDRVGKRRGDGDGKRRGDDDGKRRGDGDGERHGDGDGERRGDGDGERRRDDDERPERIKCRHCNGRGWRTCGRCRGSGRATSVSQGDIARQRQRVGRLRGQLAGAPAFVTQSFPAEWPYTVESFAKTGRLTASLSVAPAGGQPGQPVMVRDSQRHDDSTVRNANPDIGLAADPLSLPTDWDVRADLIANVASQAAQRTIATVLKARRGKLLAGVKSLADRGDAAAARETAVEAALVVEPVAAALARADLRALRNRQKLDARK